MGIKVLSPKHEYLEYSTQDYLYDAFIVFFIILELITVTFIIKNGLF